VRRRWLTFASLLIVFLTVIMVWSGLAVALEPVNLAVSKVTENSAVLVVKTDTSSNVTVEYGPAPGTYTNVQSSLGRVRHELPLNGLAASSYVYYRVTLSDTAGTASFSLPEKIFHTARNPGEPFSFAAGSDDHPVTDTAEATQVWRTIVAQMQGENLDLALLSGDSIWNLPSDSLDRTLTKYDGFFNPTRELTDSVPLYTAVGNHEFIDYPNGRTAYEQEHTLPVNNAADPQGYNEEYYSFDSGDTHFVCLCTEIPGQIGVITGNQKSWLAQDLAASDKTWKVVFLHRPLFSVYVYDDPWHDPGNSAGQQNRAEIHGLFRQYGVDLVLQGHEHYYSHSVEDGIHYVTTGGSGVKLVGGGLYGPGTVFSANVHEHVKVDVTATSMRVTAIESSGATVETFTIIWPPSLNLSRHQVYWRSYHDYLIRNLAVDYALTNTGSDTSDIQLTQLTATRGVQNQTALPVGLGDLSHDDKLVFSTEYYVPHDVSFYKTRVYVTCHDVYGTLYEFPKATRSP
jgi:hypothetical protein